MNIVKNILLFWGLIFIIGCNVCDNSGETAERTPKNILYSAKLINSSFTAVYGVERSGDLLEIISNDAVLLSPPSKDAKLAVLSPTDKHTAIYLIDMKTGESKQVIAVEAPKSIIDYGLSADSKKLYYLDNQNNCILVDIANKSSKTISNTVNTDLKPSFTQDSKYFSYLISNGDKADNTLKIVDVENPDIEIHSFALPYQINKFNSHSGAGMSWSADSKLLLFSVLHNDEINGEIAKILAVDLSNLSLDLLDLRGISASEPVISPDSKYLVFIDTEGNIRKAIKGINGEELITNIVKVNIGERCQFPSFNSAGTSLLYSKRSEYSTLQFDGNLYVTDLNTGNSRYLFSNVYAGFWYK